MDKSSLRLAMRALGPVPEDVSKSVVNGLYRWMSPRLPGTVSAFLAMTGEVDLSPLMERLPGWRWVLPRVEADRSLTFRDAGAARETHPFGMEQPVNAGPVVPVLELDLLLVPGLAFDLSGGRLGNGAGHYDRVLTETRPDAETVGIAPVSRIVAAVPVAPHDRKVGWVATERGVISCPANG